MSPEQQEVEAQAEQQPSAIADVNTAVAKFDRVAAGIATLREQYQGVLYDVTTTKGMAEACKARGAIREPRYEVERVRKECKAPILALGRDIDSRAAKITQELLALEGPIDEQIKAEEKRKEDERKAKAAAEAARVAAIHERIAELRGNQLLTPDCGSKLIAEHIDDLQRIAVDDSFAELRQLAETTKSGALERLGKLLAAAQAHEAEKQRLAAERAELERQRLANEEAARRERERIAAEEAEAKRQREAEAVAAAAERQRKLDEEMAKLRAQREENERAAKAERERLAEERRHQEAAAAERQRIEQQRIDAERAAAQAEHARIAAENARQAEELRRQQEALEAQRAELERQQAQLAAPVAEVPDATIPDPEPVLTTEAAAPVAAQEFVPSRIELVAVIAAEYGTSQARAEQWLVAAFGGAA